MIYWSCRETNSQIKRRILACRVYHILNISVNELLNMHRDTKNEILNSTSPTGSSVYFCTVDIYSFIHPWYGYLSF